MWRCRKRTGPKIRGRTISASGDSLRIGLRKWVFPHSQLTPHKLPHTSLNAALKLANNRPHRILRPLPSRTFTGQQGLATTVTTIVITKVSSRSTPSLAILERSNPMWLFKRREVDALCPSLLTPPQFHYACEFVRLQSKSLLSRRTVQYPSMTWYYDRTLISLGFLGDSENKQAELEVLWNLANWTSGRIDQFYRGFDPWGCLA